MSRLYLPALLLACVCLAASPATGQSRLRRLIESETETLPRRPNDQIEGAIYEYTATMPNSDDELNGRFRIEERAIYDVEKEIDRPDLRETIRRLRNGENSISVQTEARENRIGDVVDMSGNKTKLDFTDSEDLPGFAVIWPQEDRTGVWIGYFQELEDGKAGRRWRFAVRVSED